jgi:hypothetical protein
VKYLLFLMTFILVSCAEKPETELKVSIGATGTNTNFDGGLILLGKSDNGFKVSKVIPLGDSAEIFLPNGRWNFAVIGWDNAGAIMEGDSYCDFKPNIALTGQDIALNFNATEANCINPIFGGNIENTDQFQKIELTPCTGVNKWINYFGLNNIPDGVNCNGNPEHPLPGEFKSFKVIIPEAIAGNNQLITAGGLNSGCQHNSGSFPVYTSLRLPKGSPNVPIPYIIIGYSNASCDSGSGYTKEFKFLNGLSGLAQNGGGGAKYDSSINSGVDEGTRIFLNSVPCNTDMLNAQQEAYDAIDAVDGGGLDGSADHLFPISATGGSVNSYLICSKDDLEEIANGTTGAVNGVYNLGQSINLTGSNTTIATFNGQFNGNGHTISNGNNPLFGTMNTQPTTEIRINDFKLTDFTITSSADTGVLVNTISGGAGHKQVDIDGVEIRNSSITNATDNSRLGGLVGSIDGGAFTDIISLRQNNVQVDLIGSGNNQKIGGLVGYSDGGSGEIAYEGNLVGIADLDDTSDRSAAIDITYSGATDYSTSGTGGLIGFSTHTEIRDFNFVIADISAVERVGGLVGVADADTDIKNSYANLEFSAASSCTNATVSTCAQVGGIVGKIPALLGTEKIEIKGTISTLAIPSSNDNINYVGGVLGDYYSTGAAADIKIEDTRSFVEVESFGHYHGGVVGSINVTTAFTDFVIKRAYVQGSLVTGDAGSGGNSKGGIAGHASHLKTKMTVVDIIIEGYNSLGGAYGYTNNAVQVDESYIKSELLTKWTADNAYMVGGAFGQMNTLPAANGILNSKIITNIYLPGVGVEPANTAELGLTYGKLNVSQSGAIDYMFDTSIFIGSMFYDTNDTAFSGDVYNNFSCGSSSDVTAACGAGTLLSSNFAYFNDSSGTCSSLTGMSTPFFYEAVAGRNCVPLFEHKWRGAGLVSDGTNEYYKAGSKLEPLPISSPADWNAIKTDEFLLNKTFELTQNIDFNFGTFHPIGVTYEAAADVVNQFKGQLLANGHKVMNIQYSPSNVDNNVAVGLIHGVDGDARIGERYAPFTFENVTLECNGGGDSSCGLIGEAQNANLFVNAKNITITSTLANQVCIGGVLGRAEIDGTIGSSRVEIENTIFDGHVDGSNATVANSAQGVGGLVGCAGDNNAPTNVELFIENSTANIRSLIGLNNIGGIVGKVYSDVNNFEIKNSYAHLIPDNTNNPQVEAFAASPTAYAGIVGSIDTNTLLLENLFVDFTQGSVDDLDDLSVFIGAGATTSVSASNFIYVDYPAPFTASDAEIGTVPTPGVYRATTQSLLNQAVDDTSTTVSFPDSFVKDGNRFKLKWEVEGFNN